MYRRFYKNNKTKFNVFSGVDFQVKTIRIDMKNIALQLWDTAGKYKYKQQHKYHSYSVYL